MKLLAPCVLSLAASTSTLAQTTAPALKSAAYAAYFAKNYRQAGQLCDQAWALPGTGKAPGDCYDAACSWALASEATKAFADPDRALAAGWDNLAHLKIDEELASLQADKRWLPFLHKAEATIARAEARQNLSL
ncbi:MAG: hypothetical protein EOO59_15070 [Hymenobacter sp.]|nr:MAG: hypothetical protein EOO59_15070 [Hymenobacter sp.]